MIRTSRPYTDGCGRSAFAPRAARGRRLAAWALLALVLLAAGTVSAQDPEGRLSPDYPMLYYWFRTGRPVPSTATSLDPRLVEVGAAFGNGDFDLTRQAAQAILDETEDPLLRLEAASLLVESHLGVGDFAGARAAAESSDDKELLARVNRLEVQYNTEVNRLQQAVASPKDPEEAARAQLRTARTHQAYGRLDLAEQSYRKVIRRYPASLSAVGALAALVSLHQRRGDAEGGIAVCQEIIGLMPEAPAAGAAAGRILTLCAAMTPPDYGAAIDLLSRVAADHPGTTAAAAARSVLAETQLKEGLRLWEGRSYLAAAQELERALAEATLDAQGTLAALHTIGLCYDATEQLEKAIPYLARALELSGGVRQQFDICWVLGICHYKLHDYQEGYHLLRFAASLPVADNLREMAADKAAECVIQAEAAGRPFATQ